ncbi:MAG: hypothetical protein NC335_12660, partial [Bacteroides sp.]|nr:hypothetical protein [Bacteroides sp.]
TDEQKLKYENDMINELDKLYAISENYAKGFAEGEAKGEARGEARGRQEGLKEGESRGEAKRNLELAKAMKAKGLSITDIADITGLQIAEIGAL